MNSLNRQLKKGALDIVVLKLMEDGRVYGYELMSKLMHAGDGFFTMKEGTLYPILYRLEDAGYILSEWASDAPKRGVPRKYYTLTPAGRTYLAQARRELGQFIHSIEMIMEVK